ncbi:MAG: hypothetical protein ACRDGE_08130, partial [Candidatus Limnocylindria bacterium]
LSRDESTAVAGAVLAAIGHPAVAAGEAHAEVVAESAAAVAERIVSVASRQVAAAALDAEERRIGSAPSTGEQVVAAVKRLAQRAQDAVKRARQAKDAGASGTLAAEGLDRP